MTKHDIGGPLFVGLMVTFAGSIGVSLVASVAAFALRLRPATERANATRWLRRVAAIAAVAAPVSLLLAGAVFVWLS